MPAEWRGPGDVVVDVGDGRQLLVAGVEDAGAGSLWVGTVDELLHLSTKSVRIDT